MPRAKTARTKGWPQEWGRVRHGELADSLGFLLRRAQLSVLSHLVTTLSPLDLRPAQFSILALIDANPDLAQSDLGAALGIQRPNFVAMLDELESRGLTKRCVSRSDRRIKTLTLTPEGTRLLKRAAAIHDAHEDRLLMLLGENGVRQFEKLLKRLVDD